MPGEKLIKPVAGQSLRGLIYCIGRILCHATVVCRKSYRNALSATRYENQILLFDLFDAIKLVCGLVDKLKLFYCFCLLFILLSFLLEVIHDCFFLII